MDVLKLVLGSVLFIVSVILAKKIFAWIKYGYVLFRDYFVLWNVAFGAHPTRRNLSQPMRLHPYVCNPKLLDNISMEELFVFAKSMASSDITCETFRKVVVSYKYAIIFRERMDGSLRGMCLLGKNETEHNGRKLIMIKLGLAFFHNYYQGGPYLYFIIIYHVLKALIFHPRTPVFVLTKLFSYKSYLALVNTCNVVYPVHNKETPEFERSLLNSFAKSVRFPDEIYNPETFVLEREMSHVKPHAATIKPQDLENPHVRFFATQNPGWEKGHCMFCICQVTWSTLIKAMKKSIGRAIRGRAGGVTDRVTRRTYSEKFRQHYDRHLSFQGTEAAKAVLDNYTIKDGQAVFRPREKEDIYVENSEH